MSQSQRQHVRPALEVVSKHAPARLVAIDHDVVQIGRDSASEIVIDDPRVSRAHARIVRRADGFYVEDLESYNLTYLDDRKLGWAKGFGATHTINAGQGDVVEAVQELTGGFGADVVIEAVGRPETWKQAFYARDLAGVLVLVGVPTPDMKVPDLPLLDVFGRGGALKSSWYGDCLPSRDFPMLVDLYRQGRFDLDAFVSEEIGIGDVEAAFEKMHRGEVLRSVVVL